MASKVRLLLYGGIASVGSYYGLNKYYSNGIDPKSTIKPTEELLVQHEQIWNLMQLSQKSQIELQNTVKIVNEGLQKNYAENPTFMDQFKSPNRQQPSSLEDYIKQHSQRFDKLGLTPSTKSELLSAAKWTWNVLHIANYASSNEDMERAKTIQKMMKDLNGPPICCDDNIFIKSDPKAIN